MTGMPPATDASKASATPFSSASAGERHAVLGQQRLVGGDHVLAGAQGGLHDCPGRPFRTADQFDHAIHLVGGGERERDRRTSV